MNERIKELYKQAGLTMNNPLAYEQWYLDSLEKFAELIVEECIEQGNTLAKHYINTHTEQEQAFLLAAIADYSNEINQHFGVKE